MTNFFSENFRFFFFQKGVAVIYQLTFLLAQALKDLILYWR